MRPKKYCIFCETRTVTKEHFWPEWLGPYLPRQSGRPSRTSQFFKSEGKAPLELVRHSERAGHTYDRKIRAVCSRCNNGWMSVLEELAKPTILSFVQGQASILAPDAGYALAQWAAVKSIVAEHSTDEAVLTPVEDRRALQIGTIPDWLHVHVALHSCPTQAIYYRNSTTLAFSPTGPDPPLPARTSRNVSATSFLVGPLFFFVTCARINDFDHRLLYPSVPMTCLWPRLAEAVDLAAWPPLSTLELAEAGGTLERLFASPVVRWQRTT